MKAYPSQPAPSTSYIPELLVTVSRRLQAQGIYFGPRDRKVSARCPVQTLCRKQARSFRQYIFAEAVACFTASQAEAVFFFTISSTIMYPVLMLCPRF